MKNIYDTLGVAGCINAAGTLTRLSGSLMPPDVLQAMHEAAQQFVRLDELQWAVGRRLAEITGSEAAVVTSGAAASLTLAAAACIARDSFAIMDRLPQTEGVKHEIIMPRSHRNGYDHALRAAGARIVEVGLAERTRDPQRWELQSAISSNTVALAYCTGFSELPLDLVVEVAKAHHLPVIVDASASLPPRRNLTALIEAGADLVAYSGGKGLRGPQASGILCGRKELIASAALQMWDVDFLPELWNPPGELIPASWLSQGVPNHGLGRAMKVGKEEIVGLWAAVERFVALDGEAENQRLAGYVSALSKRLMKCESLEVRIVERIELWPLLEIQLKSSRPQAGIEVARRLEAGDPAVYMNVGFAHERRLLIDPFCLSESELETVAQAMERAVKGL